MLPRVRATRRGDGVECVTLVCAGPEELFELGPVGQDADDLDLAQAGLLLDLPAEPLLEALVSVDTSGRHLRRHFGPALVVEDQELATAGDVTDDPLAYERADEVASFPPGSRSVEVTWS